MFLSQNNSPWHRIQFQDQGHPMSASYKLHPAYQKLSQIRFCLLLHYFCVTNVSTFLPACCLACKVSSEIMNTNTQEKRIQGSNVSTPLCSMPCVYVVFKVRTLSSIFGELPVVFSFPSFLWVSYGTLGQDLDLYLTRSWY